MLISSHWILDNVYFKPHCFQFCLSMLMIIYRASLRMMWLKKVVIDFSRLLLLIFSYKNWKLTYWGTSELRRYSICTWLLFFIEIPCNAHVFQEQVKWWIFALVTGKFLCCCIHFRFSFWVVPSNCEVFKLCGYFFLHLILKLGMFFKLGCINPWSIDICWICRK